MIRLSVVIPGYRTPDWQWERCVNSVLNAIGPNDEVVCVDDGSGFRSAYLSNVSGRDHRVRAHFCETNKGQAVARNVGIEKTTGKYVAFVDSDDEVLPGIYDKAVEFLDETESDILVYGVSTRWIGLGLKRDNAMPRKIFGGLDEKGLLEIYSNWLFPYPWNKVYRRSFLDEKGIRFQPCCIPREDEVLNLTCVLKGARWCSISEIGHAYYHQVNTSLSRYRRYNREANEQVNEHWCACAKELHSDEILRRVRPMSDWELCASDWINMWRRESPVPVWRRIRWYWEHPELGGLRYFIKSLLFLLMRRYLYVSPLRKWHVKRVYPEVVPWK